MIPFQTKTLFISAAQEGLGALNLYLHTGNLEDGGWRLSAPCVQIHWVFTIHHSLPHLLNQLVSPVVKAMERVYDRGKKIKEMEGR